jgi:hypothetical protein
MKQLNELTESEKIVFDFEFERRKKSKLIAWLLWAFLGWHYGYVNKWWLQVLYILTFGGACIWMFIDIFRIKKLINNYNQNLTFEILSKF